MNQNQPCPDPDCDTTVNPNQSYCSSCGSEIPDGHFTPEKEDNNKPNKRTWLMVLLVHKAHETGQYEFTTSKVQQKVKNSVSKKTIRRARDELQNMGLVEHETGAKKWFFKPNEP
jgi:ribosomal protein L32